MRPPAIGDIGAYTPEGSRKKAKPMEIGNKLVEKSVFKTLRALPHVLCPVLYNSDFQSLTSVICSLYSDL